MAADNPLATPRPGPLLLRPFPFMNYSTHIDNPDIILVGSGVMSANLAALLKRLQPTLKIQVYEVTSDLAQESSHGWNNAGTGHAGI